MIPRFAALLLLPLVLAGCDALIVGHDHTIHRLVQSGDNAALERELVRHPEDVELQGAWGRTALGYAVSTRNEQAITILLKHGASPSCPDMKGITPLMIARDHIEIYKDLPGYLKTQEDFLRQQPLSQAQMQQQMARINSANPPGQLDQWLRIYDMLGRTPQPTNRPGPTDNFRL
jgi:hypothetical protein